METGIYVDVLLVINYAVSVALLTCTAKIAGRSPRGCRIVAAALAGSVSSLTIFLPFLGFIPSILLKLGISAGMVLIAFRWMSPRIFFKEWFLFFAVTFCFAGVMLGLWMTLKPSGMLYYNGVVYFNISSFTLLAATAAAYCVLELIHRLARRGRVKERIYKVKLTLNGRSLTIRGLVDTGNSLYEPFSGMPVMVCSLESIAPLLPAGTAEAILGGGFESGTDCGLPLRGVPYGNVGGKGLLPAFRPDRLILSSGDERMLVENAYVAVSGRPVGNERYEAILNPDMAGINTNLREFSISQRSG